MWEMAVFDICIAEGKNIRMKIDEKKAEEKHLLWNLDQKLHHMGEGKGGEPGPGMKRAMNTE